MIIFTRGRKQTVNTQSHFCPDLDCSDHGYFYEVTGPIFYGKRSSPELIVRVIVCLAEGLGIRGTARVFEIDPNTVRTVGWHFGLGVGPRQDGYPSPPMP